MINHIFLKLLCVLMCYMYKIYKMCINIKVFNVICVHIAFVIFKKNLALKNFFKQNELFVIK